MILKIKLTHIETGAEWYVFPGAIVGRTGNEVNIDDTDLGTIKFRFIVGEDQKCLFEYVDGDHQRITIDRNNISLESPLQVVKNGTLLVLGNTKYKLTLIHEDERIFWEAVYTTVTGSVRRHNEDALAIYQRPPMYLFAVADGVGGEANGDDVSAYVCQAIIQKFKEVLDTPDKWSIYLKSNIQSINDHVRAFGIQRSNETNHRQEPGTTLTALAIHKTHLLVLHVGDSRLYRLRDGRLQRLTQDHVVSKSSSVLIAKDQRYPPKQTRLLRAIGRDDKLKLDTIFEEALLGDIYLLCTDGLTDRIEEEELSQLLQAWSFSDLPDYLAHLADIREGRDNISLILLRTTNHSLNLSTRPIIPRVYTGNKPVDTLLDVEFTKNLGGYSRFSNRYVLLILFILATFFLAIAIIIYLQGFVLS